MRDKERIPAYLAVVGELWEEYAPDMRLGQFLECTGVDWNTEDLTQGVIKVATFCKKDPVDYLLWGTRGKSGKCKLQYKKLVDLETSHLEAILLLFQSIPKHIIIEACKTIIESRKNI